MRWVMISTIIWALSGCGFHLKGMNDMPFWLNDVAVIIQNAHRDLGPLLEKQLQSYPIRICNNPEHAQYWLIVEHDEVHQQINSISSSTTPRQYQQIYTLTFKLQRANGKDILCSRQILVTRESTLNSQRILGSTSETELLRREMRQDAVVQILNQISRAPHD